MEELVKILMFLGFAGVVVWLMWRGFIVLWLLFSPARRAIRARTDATLRAAGLGKIADLDQKLNDGLDGAVRGTLAASGVDPVPTPDTHVRCPDCRELVRSDARKCKHCGSALIPQQV